MENAKKISKKKKTLAFFITVLVSIIIPIIYGATDNTTYELIINSESGVKENAEFNINVKSTNTENLTETEILIIKLGDKIELNETILKERNIEYKYDLEANTLEIEGNNIKDIVEIPVKALTSGETTIELYKGSENIDIKTINIEKEVSILPPPSKNGKSTDVHVPDPNLRKAINSKLGRGLISTPETFTIEEMESLVEISYQETKTTEADKITDLTGLEYARNVERIFFGENSITDLTPIENLTKINNLSLPNNKNLENVEPIGKITSVERLTLYGTSIADISSFQSLSNLNYLLIFSAKLTNIDSLSNLTKLTNLNVMSNQITDITPVTNLTKLTSLNVMSNKITDITPVTNLTNLTELVISFNQISNITSVTNLTNLTKLEFRNNSISDISALSNKTALKTLNMSYNRISDITPLNSIIGNITKFDGINQTIDLGSIRTNGSSLSLDNNIKTIGGILAPKTISNSGIYDPVNNKINWTGISNNQSLNYSFSDAARNFTGQVKLVTKQSIYIPDPNLRKVINSSLGRGLVSSPEYFTIEEMKTPTKLYYGDSAKADADKIVDLTGLEYATNLTEINFSFNKISDLAPISNLSKLEILYMNSNRIVNLPNHIDRLVSLKNLYLTSNQIVGLPDNFAKLSNLITLYLHTNKITSLPSNFGSLKQLKTLYAYSNELTSLPDSIVDITSLDLLSVHHNKLTSLPDNIGNLTNLTKLYANDNQITELPSSFGNLSKLVYLDASKNLLTNISQVSGITTLKDLIARNNQISDVSSLESLTGLVNVNLGFNKVSDLTPISKLEKLTSLDFTANSIKNIEALENIISLTSVSLGQNQISDITPLTNLTEMTMLNLYQNKVSDINSLSDKSKLIYLILSYNNISDISSLDKIIGGITTFDAGSQTVNLGTVKINGNRLSLYNPTKTIEGIVPVTIVSGGGTYNSIDSTINWTNIEGTQSRNFTFKDGKRNFGGIVNLNIERIGIKDPINPDIDNPNPNQEGVVDSNHDLKLAINYIEPIDFGTVGIESRNMDIEAVTKTPYIQISDLRDNPTGWKLNVSGTTLKEQSGTTIDGVRIRLKNGETKSSPSGNALAPTIEKDILISLDNSSITDVMKAENGKGAGTWLGVWGGTGTTNEKVIMEVPQGKARVGIYETTLNWTLSDTP